MSKKFRSAFILQQGKHDFSLLNQHADRLVFTTTGYETEEDILDTLRVALEDLDPLTDVLVPVGNAPACFLMGAVALERARKVGAHFLTLAYYQQKEYHFKPFNVHQIYPTEEIQND